MNLNQIVDLTSLATSSVAAIMGLRFYRRFGFEKTHWGWLLMFAGTLCLAISESFDVYSSYHNGLFTEQANIFGITTEILLTFGFIRLFNTEFTNEKKRTQKLESNLKQSGNLLYAALQITGSLNLEETIQNVLKRTAELTGADCVSIYLVRDGVDSTQKTYIIQPATETAPFLDYDLEFITAEIKSTGKAIFGENQQEIIKLLPGANSNIGLNAICALPLKEKGLTKGVLFVGYHQDHHFDEDQHFSLIMLADHVSLAIINAQLYEQVETLSITDHLTGLSNRRQFDKVLEAELVRARRYSYSLTLLLMDIDNFKEINNSIGHLGGDHAIHEISNILLQKKRIVDLCARVGCDEMALILPHCSQEEAIRITERLFENIHKIHIEWNGKIQPITCSIGLSGGVSENLPENSTELFEQADSALFSAKTKGRNRLEIFNRNPLPG